MPNKYHHTDIQMRFNDTDAFQHVNNTSFALYAEQARLEFLYDLGQRVIGVDVDQKELGIILAHISLDFRRQTRYGDSVYVKTSIKNIGNTSLTLKQDIFVNEELAVETSSVLVYFDYETEKPRPIPEEIRTALLPYLHPTKAKTP